MSEAAHQRLFVALELPGDVRAALARWGRSACDQDPSLRAVRDQALHVTVHFLGERPTADVERLREVVAGASDRAIPLVGAGALWLSPRRPHVLTCALEDPGGSLGDLFDTIGPALTQATPGWESADRRLRPHVTVARVRGGARPRVGAEPEPPVVRFEATAVALMRSDLGPGGAVYEAIERLPLRSLA